MYIKKGHVLMLVSPLYYRVPQMVENVSGAFVSWQIVGDVLDECDEKSNQLLKKAVFRAYLSQYSTTY